VATRPRSPLGAVLGTFRRRTSRDYLSRQAAHSGSTPMNRRKTPFSPRENEPFIYQLAQAHGGVCTIGSCHNETWNRDECRRGLPYYTRSTASRQRINSKRLYWDARDASEQFAEDANVEVHWERLLANRPPPLQRRTHPILRRGHLETCGKSHRLPAARSTTPPKSPPPASHR